MGTMDLMAKQHELEKDVRNNVKNLIPRDQMGMDACSRKMARITLANLKMERQMGKAFTLLMRVNITKGSL